jgi:hypothetical protein
MEENQFEQIDNYHNRVLKNIEKENQMKDCIERKRIEDKGKDKKTLKSKKILKEKMKPKKKIKSGDANVENEMKSKKIYVSESGEDKDDEDSFISRIRELSKKRRKKLKEIEENEFEEKEIEEKEIEEKEIEEEESVVDGTANKTIDEIVDKDPDEAVDDILIPKKKKMKCTSYGEVRRISLKRLRYDSEREEDKGGLTDSGKKRRKITKIKRRKPKR